MKLALPSTLENQLRTWVGLKFVKISRLLYDDPKSIPSLYNIPSSKVFSFFSAPLILELNNQQRFRVEVNTQRASIVLGEIHLDIGKNNTYIVDISDPVYSERKFQQVIDSVIQDIVIYKRHPKNKKLELRAREAGLGIKLDNGKQLIMSCGLHDGSDDFSIIYLDDVPNELRFELKEKTLLT